MTTSSPITKDDVRARAREVVTAYVNDDRALADCLITTFPYPGVLAMALAELTALVHLHWSLDIGAPHAAAWPVVLAVLDERGYP